MVVLHCISNFLNYYWMFQEEFCLHFSMVSFTWPYCAIVESFKSPLARLILFSDYQRQNASDVGCSLASETFAIIYQLIDEDMEYKINFMMLIRNAVAVAYGETWFAISVPKCMLLSMHSAQRRYCWLNSTQCGYLQYTSGRWETNALHILHTLGAHWVLPCAVELCAPRSFWQLIDIST